MDEVNLGKRLTRVSFFYSSGYKHDYIEFFQIKAYNNSGGLQSVTNSKWHMRTVLSDRPSVLQQIPLTVKDRIRLATHRNNVLIKRK